MASCSPKKPEIFSKSHNTVAIDAARARTICRFREITPDLTFDLLQAIVKNANLHRVGTSSIEQKTPETLWAEGNVDVVLSVPYWQYMEPNNLQKRI